MANNASIDGLSDDQLLAAFGAKGSGVPIPTASGPPGIDHLSDDDLISAFTAPPAPPSSTPLPAQKGLWDGLQNFASADLLGAGPAIKAGAAAVKETAGAVSRGMPLSDAPAAIKDYYAQAKDTYDAARAGYAAEHPILAPVTQAAGNIAGTVPLMMAGGAIAGAGGAALSKAVPAAAPVVDFLSGAYQGNKLLGIASQGVNGAIQGAAGNALLAGDTDQSFGDQVKQGALAGGALGVAVPAVASAGRGIVNKLTGGGVNPETAQLADTALNKFGIPLRGGQISESPFVKYADSALTALPFSGYAGKQAAAHDAFTQAVSKTFGEDTPAITSDVMQAAKSRIGKMFDDVAANTTIKADQPFIGALAKVESDAGQVLSSTEMAPIKTQLDNILGKVDANGELSGDVYQALTRKGAPLDRAMSSADPNVKYYAGQVRSALDDALERSASPDVLDTLQKARGQYKNMKTIEDLAEKSPDGRISPALLLGQVRKSFGNYAYGGGGDLGDLAKIGQRFLKEPPNSGTATRNLVHGMLAGGAGVGEMALYANDPKLALAGLGAAAGGALASRGLGYALDNPLYRNSLIRSGNTAATSAAQSQALQNFLSRSISPTVILGNRLLMPSPVNR